ncbi:GNAT superfamily N-acetyltransferase [Streptomyces sp. SAI-117]|uniref:GNAT family N-acetyltransferase n=2 Tax=Streptomyces TaxID=1883 RepID=UPI0024734958|nr:MULTISPECIES: GNAT family N-acetyltransferase [unclassified Streptomyces]MDH6553910.1 GNAT superfamily N-acetyltransferase [Streptomyces sp. SAI-041]MDH6572988.1 GNAT superfamily N-acetyltransferase [Streptomyces sp. SAI-117]MDH6582050.1 GNAT superfamily N-acetyltransferase [Streptomyces sp. SAI-133]
MRTDMNREPLFCDVPLARRIERVEAHLMAAAAEAARLRRGDDVGFVRWVAGAVAAFAEDDSPFNKIAGLGFAGMPEAAALAEIERAFADRGAPVQAEISELADPAVGTLLTARGYRLESFENVLGLALDGTHERATHPRIEVRVARDEEFEAWLDVVADGFAHPDGQGVPSHEEFSREVLTNAERDFTSAGVVPYIALYDGTVAGGGSLRVADGVAQLTGAATAPAHRRRGVQSALLSARLSDAAAAGCDIAVVTTQPGSTSQQNVHRQGFHLLYTRAVLVRRMQPRKPVARPDAPVTIPHEVRVVPYDGPRKDIRPLFELAEDSAAQLDSYIEDGRVLVALRGTEVVGHLQWVATHRADTFEIKNMAVREDVQRTGVGGLLVRSAIDLVSRASGRRLLVATAAADTGNLRFYQRHGFRVRTVERDAFTARTGYEPGTLVDGIELRDRIWLDRPIGTRSGSDPHRPQP